MIVPAVVVKVPVVAPEATVIDAGVVSRALLSDSATAVPPEGATLLSVTVQVELAKEFNDVGLHDNEVNPGAATPPGPLIVPPVPCIIVALPDGKDATTLPTPTAVLLTPAAMVILITATTPFAIVVAFIP